MELMTRISFSFCQFNTFIQGTVGVLCQPPTCLWNEAGADGSIWWFICFCDYALRSNNSCYQYYAQKIAPLLW